jgi:hypothetical protein
MAADLRVPMDPIVEAFGVPATVTRPAPEDTPIETTGVWVSPTLMEMPVGMDLQRAERRRIFSLRRDAVPTVPRGTLIEAPERESDAVLRWRVNGIEMADADHVRVIVIPVPEES